VRADKPLSSFEIRLYRHYRVVHGVRIALAFILSFLLVRLLDVPEGTWPLITLVVIMGPISFWGNVLPRALERIGERSSALRWGWWRCGWSFIRCR
jgi:uncharacterized membrane protein YccC